MDRLAPWLDRTRIAYLAVALVLVVGAWRVTASTAPHPPETPPISPLVTAPASAEAPGPLVHVAGAVRRPGVYCLPAGARAQAALRRAGGPAHGADLSALNLAAEVVDGQQLLVPRRGPGGAPAATGGGTASGPVSLSTADAEQLDALDGIGPTLAQRIVDWRTSNGPFRSVDDLLDVPGIGEARLEALRAKVTP